jgi:uncharacterized protein
LIFSYLVISYYDSKKYQPYFDFVTLANLIHHMLHSPESDYILERLERELPAYLYYHSAAHTLDVYRIADMMGKDEKLPENQRRLLLAAVLYHDAGYLVQSEGHEEISCSIARDVLPTFAYTLEETDHICDIIMATRIPQQPVGLLQAMICDADLDYLGRADFFKIGQRLFLELQTEGKVKDESEWRNMQIDFMKNHQYFTDWSRLKREAGKQKNLNQLLSLTTNP